MSSINTATVTRKPRPMPGSPAARTSEQPTTAEFVTVEAAARLASVTPHAIVRWMRREGRSLRLLRSDLAAFLVDPKARVSNRRGATRSRHDDPRQLSFIDPRRDDA